jgi:hypothetical protein
MNRRKFLGSAVVSGAAAASTLSFSAARAGQESPAPAAPGREYYELRRYHILAGPQKTLADAYFRDALIPALNRIGVKPVGAFNVYIGNEGTASCYLLLPAAKVETLATIEEHLADDAEYQKAGAAFLNAPARDPGFVRVESSLLRAFDAVPHVVVPPAGPRLFEMRTYESTTPHDHVRKVEMMNAGELGIFKKAGLSAVFMGDRLIGPCMPSLTYMLSFATLADREKGWEVFFGAPEWKALTANPRYAFEPLVSNNDNEILSPTAYSQI